MSFQPENPGDSIKPEWLMRQLHRAGEEIELASNAGADQWTAKATTGAGGPTNDIWLDVNATDWSGHQHEYGDTGCLEITNNDIVTFGNGTGNAFLWAGPKPVLLGQCAGAYVSTEADYEAIASIDHEILLNRDSPNQHPQSAITGLESRLTTDEGNLATHVGDTGNPHDVTYDQAGAAPLVHTHVETDVTDLNRVRAQGDWVEQQFSKNDMVSQNGYMGVALVDTTDPMAPVPVGDPLWLLPDDPLWQAGSDLSLIQSGFRIHDLQRAFRIASARAWLPDVSDTVEYNLQYTDNTTGVTHVSASFVGSVIPSPGWAVVAIDPLFLSPGADVSFRLIAQKSDNTTDFDFPWNYIGASNQEIDPGSGNVNNNTQQTVLRLSRFDANAVDRITELSTIIPGTKIFIVDSVDILQYYNYTVNGAYVDNGTYLTLPVVLQETGAGGPPGIALTNVSIVVPTPQETQYVYLLGYVAGNDQIDGTLSFDGVDQPGHEDDAFGIDLEVQEYTVSPDWHIYSTPGGTTSSGEGGETTPVDNDPVFGNTAHAISSDWAYQHQEGTKSQHDYNDLLNLPTIPLPQTYLHADLTDVAADDHHAQAHAHDGTDGSGTVSYNDLTDAPSGTGYWEEAATGIKYLGGNVGIGVEPQHKLHVQGHIALAGGFHLKSNADSDVTRVIGGTTYNAGASIQLRGSNIVNPSEANYQGFKHHFKTGPDTGFATERVTIDDVGNVGIGIDSPLAKFHVAGGLSVFAKADAYSLPGISSWTSAVFQGGNHSYINIHSSGTNAGACRILFSDGDGPDSGSLSYDHRDSKMSLWNGAAQRVTLDSTGRVGIATDSPSEKLNVVGNILATGTITGSNTLLLENKIAALETRLATLDLLLQSHGII